jgi:hypothetical protein
VTVKHQGWRGRFFEDFAVGDVGIVTVRTTGFNQDGTEVISFRRTAMIYRRRQGPAASRPSKD